MRHRRGWFALGAALLLGVALAACVVVARQKWRARADTEARLRNCLAWFRTLERKGFLPTRSSPSGDDPGTGPLIDALRAARRSVVHPDDPDTFGAGCMFLTMGVEHPDSWGRTFVYRCPGVVHTHGWDLYSFGPNGEDEQGEGDDILVGEDVASLGSGS